ncbi:MAG: hypothetical protein ACRD0Z_17450 [Acidimicrobiales bacterium]
MPSPWWTRRAFGLHATLAVCVPLFFALAWWQLHRAIGGNVLSWAYTFEWPFFACYAVWTWWRLIHDESAVPHRHREGDGSTVTVAGNKPHDPYDEADPELAAYNRYLASLHAADEQRKS